MRQNLGWRRFLLTWSINTPPCLKLSPPLQPEADSKKHWFCCCICIPEVINYCHSSKGCSCCMIILWVVFSLSTCRFTVFVIAYFSMEIVMMPHFIMLFGMVVFISPRTGHLQRDVLLSFIWTFFVDHVKVYSYFTCCIPADITHFFAPNMVQ